MLGECETAREWRYREYIVIVKRLKSVSSNYRLHISTSRTVIKCHLSDSSQNPPQGFFDFRPQTTEKRMHRSGRLQTTNSMNPWRGYLTGWRDGRQQTSTTPLDKGEGDEGGIQTIELRESWSLAHFWIISRFTHVVFLLAHFRFYHPIDKQDQPCTKGPRTSHRPDNPACTHTNNISIRRMDRKKRRINKSIIDDECSKINQCVAVC